MSDAPISLDELKLAIARHAGQDGAFRQALLADPKEAVQQLLKIDLPAHVRIQVVEEAPGTHVVVLPTTRAGDDELTDADLEAVAGGAKAAGGGKAAQELASAVFGTATGVPAILISEMAKGTGDRKLQESAGDAGIRMSTCNVRSYFK